MQANEQAIRQVVEEVLSQLGKRGRGPVSTQPKSGDWGVFPTVDQAADAAEAAFQKLRDSSIQKRAQPLSEVRPARPLWAKGWRRGPAWLCA